MSIKELLALDKLVHLGFGGLICGCLTLLALCQDCPPTDLHGLLRFVACWGVGLVCTLALALAKELSDLGGSGWGWGDLLATAVGTLPVLAATVLGWVLYHHAATAAMIP